MFRGGPNSLPIISPNLSFQEFFSRMNKMSQIRTTEHFLHQDEGNTIVATKKKRLTFADKSSNASRTSDTYCKSFTYAEFFTQLNDTCTAGDEDSSKAIERLAPLIADRLKKANEFLHPNCQLNLVNQEI